MVTLQEITFKYGKHMVISGEAAFTALGYKKNYFGDKIVLAFMPTKAKMLKNKEFRALRIKHGNIVQKVGEYNVLHMCVVFAYLCMKNYPQESLLEFYYELLEHKFKKDQIFKYCSKHTFRKYPIFRHIPDNFKSPAEFRYWIQMFDRKIPRPEVNMPLFLTDVEKYLYAENTGYQCLIPDFIWVRQRIVIEYQGGYHGEGDTYLKDADKGNFYQNRGITFFQATKENWEKVLEEVAELLHKRRGWKKCKNCAWA